MKRITLAMRILLCTILGSSWPVAHLRSHLQNLLTSSPTGEITVSSTPRPVTVDSDADGLKSYAVSLAKQALSASKHAASVAKELKSIKANDADPLPFGLVLSEITADSEFEIPDASVSKLLMRRHAACAQHPKHLKPKKRRIIRLRFGIEEDQSLSEIGKVFCLTKERIQHLESRALIKLKQCLVTEGLDAYVDLIV